MHRSQVDVMIEDFSGKTAKTSCLHNKNNTSVINTPLAYLVGSTVYSLLVGGMAQWLERRSSTGELSLIYS